MNKNKIKEILNLFGIITCAIGCVLSVVGVFSDLFRVNILNVIRHYTVFSDVGYCLITVMVLSSIALIASLSKIGFPNVLIGGGLIFTTLFFSNNLESSIILKYASYVYVKGSASVLLIAAGAVVMISGIIQIVAFFIPKDHSEEKKKSIIHYLNYGIVIAVLIGSGIAFVFFRINNIHRQDTTISILQNTAFGEYTYRNFDQAEILYNEALDIRVDDAISLQGLNDIAVQRQIDVDLQSARDAMIRGDYDNAIHNCDLILNIESNNSDANSIKSEAQRLIEYNNNLEAIYQCAVTFGDALVNNDDEALDLNSTAYFRTSDNADLAGVRNLSDESYYSRQIYHLISSGNYSSDDSARQAIARAAERFANNAVVSYQINSWEIDEINGGAHFNLTITYMDYGSILNNSYFNEHALNAYDRHYESVYYAYNSCEYEWQRENAVLNVIVPYVVNDLREDIPGVRDTLQMNVTFNLANHDGNWEIYSTDYL